MVYLIVLNSLVEFTHLQTNSADIISNTTHYKYSIKVKYHIIKLSIISALFLSNETKAYPKIRPKKTNE